MIGLEPDSEMISQVVTDYDQNWMGQLELNHGDEVLLAKRLYHGDGIPIFYVEMCFPLKMFPGIEKIDFNHISMYDAVRRIYDLKVSRIQRSLTAVILSDEICDIFDIPHGSAGFKIESLVLTVDGHPMELSINYLKGIGASVSIDYFKQLKL
jgi:DNA-binding GntR family transcriptional regulator